MDNSKFPLGYRDDLFLQWYNSGKPSINQFFLVIEPHPTVGKPSLATVRVWRKGWGERAEVLDESVRRELEKNLIASKVEMFERHADIGKKMQEISMGWLKKNKDSLTPGTAVRMLVDGITIEQSTAGIPDALSKMINMSDEDLKDELAELLAETPIDADN